MSASQCVRLHEVHPPMFEVFLHAFDNGQDLIDRRFGSNVCYVHYVLFRDAHRRLCHKRRRVAFVGRLDLFCFHWLRGCKVLITWAWPQRSEQYSQSPNARFCRTPGQQSFVQVSTLLSQKVSSRSLHSTTVLVLSFLTATLIGHNRQIAGNEMLCTKRNRRHEPRWL